MVSSIKKHFSTANSSILILPLVIAVMIAVIQAQNSNFLSQQNLSNIMRQVSVNAIIAFGMTMVIITGNIDLSIGSIIGFSSVIGCSVMNGTGSVTLGIIAAVIVGGLCGLVNGLLIIITGLHPFVVTLGTLTIYRGFAFLYTGGQLITGMPKRFFIINTGSVWIFPYAILITAIIFCLLRFVMYKTKYGLYLYEIGGRQEAAVSAGIPVKACKTAAYCILGALAGLAGMILTARIVTGQASAGANYHLMAIGTSVIGGASLNGGKGTLGGVLLGVFVIGIMSNGLNLLKVGSFWQDVATGIIIVIAVLLDTFQLRKKAKEL